MKHFRSLLFLILFLIVGAPRSWAQGPIPFVKSQWFNGSGQPLNGAKLCTTASGGTTPLATYSDFTVSPGSINTNPITLDSSGRANVFLTNGVLYRFTMYTAGTGSTCNGQPVGSLLWSVDGVTNARLNGTQFRIPVFQTSQSIGNGSLTDTNGQVAYPDWTPATTAALNFYQVGATGDHSTGRPGGSDFRPLAVIDISNPVNSVGGKQGLYINSKMTSSSGPRNITGLFIDHYALDDNGGETSGLHIVSTGSGDAASLFHYAHERPAGYPLPCATCGFGLEIGVDHGDAIQIQLIDNSRDSVAYQGRGITINDFATPGGYSDILIVPKAPGTGAGRFALRVDNDTGTDPRFYTMLDSGQTFIKGELDLRNNVQFDTGMGAYWNLAAGNQPYIVAKNATNFLEFKGGTGGMRVVDNAGTTILSRLTNTGTLILGNTDSADYASTPGIYSLRPIYVSTGAADASFIVLSIGGGRVALGSARTGVGTTLPLDVTVGGTATQRNETSGTDRFCIYVNGSLRLLSVSAGAIIDGGACP